MLRVVFDSEWYEELRYRVGVMYGCSNVVSIGISECGSVIAAVIATISVA